MRMEYYDDGPDSYGRRCFTLYWWTNYTPSMPYPHESVQVFHANPEKYIEICEEACKGALVLILNFINGLDLAPDGIKKAAKVLSLELE